MSGHIRKLVPFERSFFDSGELFARIGAGEYGGKALGLLEASEVLEKHPYGGGGGRVKLYVPSTVVVATEVFEAFMSRNGLYEVAVSGVQDDRIAHAFMAGDFPFEHAGDLVALVKRTGGSPLAIRSSSLLEDSLAHPFAGVYETKMIPNNQADVDARIRSLIEAVKFVYASTFFKAAADYARAIGENPREERMAVIIQEVVGNGYGDRFYPEVSGVCRSYNYYRIGTAKPEEGVVSLALGLGKTVVDGGTSWSYSPEHPRVRMPFSSIREMLYSTQLRFWAINTGPPPAYDPTKETEYLLDAELADADYDGTLKYVASTFDSSREMIVPGVGRQGARLIDFAPILHLDLWPVNDVLKYLLELYEEETGCAVEIEFALTFPKSQDDPAGLAVLQVRPMMVSRRPIDLSETIQEDPGLLVYSDLVMGNGSVAGLRDIVYIKPGFFDGLLTVQIAGEVEMYNRRLRDEGKRYVLIGFGRWGSSDASCGIPVSWGQISAAAVIIESRLPEMKSDPSQGSHFFHNLESFQICYFSVDNETDNSIDWDWLSQQHVVGETETVRHVESSLPLTVKVDGRTGHGAIWHNLTQEVSDSTNQ